jgi:hypothetical protein
LNILLVQDLSHISVEGTWFRAVDPRFLDAALSTSHTAVTASRFSPGRPAVPAFQILYVAENPLVALFEARALFGSPAIPGGLVPHPGRPLVTLPIKTSLSAVADLTNSAESAKIETNAQELTGDWRSYSTRLPPLIPPAPHTGIPPTQSLGNRLYEMGKHQGLVTFSATLPDYRILAVFVDRLNETQSYLQYSYHDLHGAMKIKRIP